MYRTNDRRVLGINLNALAQLRNVLIERAAVRHVVQAPALVEERISRDDNSPVFVKKRENLDIAETQLNRGPGAPGP